MYLTLVALVSTKALRLLLVLPCWTVQGITIQRFQVSVRDSDQSSAEIRCMRGPRERLILGTGLFPFGTGCESVVLEILRIERILKYQILRSGYGSGY